MAGMTWGEAKAQVGKPLADADSTLVPQYLSLVLRRWVGRRRWAALEATSSFKLPIGTRSLLVGKDQGSGNGTPALDFGGHISLRVGAGAAPTAPRVKIAYFEQDDFDALFGHSFDVASGPPVAFTLRGAVAATASGPPSVAYADLTVVSGDVMTTLDLFPAPAVASDAVWRYTRNVESVFPTSDSDVVLLPQSMMQGLIADAIAWGLLMETRTNDAMGFENTAKAAYADAVRDDAARRSILDGRWQRAETLELKSAQAASLPGGPAENPYPGIEIED